MLKLLFMPFWVFYVLSIVIGIATETIVDFERDIAKNKVAALEMPMPQSVNLSQFQKNENIGLMDEVNVTGWVNPNHNTHLVKTKKGVTKDERFMIVLFGANDSKSSKIAKAALVLSKSNRDRFFDEFEKYSFGYGPNGQRVKINGAASSSVGLSDLAKDALENRGLTRSKDFVFISPYFDGRQAAFAPRPNEVTETRKFGYGMAFAAFLIGLFKWKMRSTGHNQKLNTRSSASAFATSPIMSKTLASSPALHTESNHQAHFDESPIGRLQQKAQKLKMAEAAADTEFEQERLERTQAQKTRYRKIPTWIIGAGIFVGLYWLVPSDAFGSLLPLVMLLGFVFIGFKVLGVAGLGVVNAIGNLVGFGRPNKTLDAGQKTQDPFDSLR